MLDNLQPSFWMRKKKLFLNIYAEHLKNIDFDRYLCSTSPQSQLIRTRAVVAPWYVQTRCPIGLRRIVAQLRLANVFRCKISCNGTCYFLKPDQICGSCNLGLETIEHILLHCPAYNDLRQKYLHTPTSDPATSSSALRIIKILEIKSRSQLDDLTNFIARALKLRSLLTTEAPA